MEMKTPQPRQNDGYPPWPAICGLPGVGEITPQLEKGFFSKSIVDTPKDLDDHVPVKEARVTVALLGVSSAATNRPHCIAVRKTTFRWCSVRRTHSQKTAVVQLSSGKGSPSRSRSVIPRQMIIAT